MISLSSVESELEYLLKIGFLTEKDDTSKIIKDPYEYENWPELFWRLRKQHSIRPDPEINYIENGSNVLEIGSAYGRFTRKLQEKLPQASITGLELSSQFEKYRNQYIEQYPDLAKTKTVFGNIFDAENLFE